MKRQAQTRSLYATAIALAVPHILYACEEGGTTETPPAAPSAEDIQKMIDAAVATATQGLKAKNDELLGSLRTLKDKAKEFEGVDVEQLKAMKARLDQDEDTRLIAEGKTQEVIGKYTERMRAEHQNQLNALQEQIKAEAERAETYKGAVLDSQILSVTQGLHKGAVEDALLYARNVFTLDSKGKAVQIGPDGNPVLGKDGKTPFGPAEWIELQKELKPHWFPASTSGSGSGGTREAGGNGQTMKRADFDRLPPHEKASVAQKGTKIID